MEVHFDARWFGAHGIGQFAAELARRNPQWIAESGGLKPTHPLDVVYTTIRLLAHPRGLWLSPGYNVPVCGLRRYVFTLHDLNHVDLAANSGALKRLYYRWVIRRACARAARVLTVSEFSRQRIVAWARVAPQQVVNVGNGVSERYHRTGAVFDPGYPYFLCVSNRKPHKNEARVLRALAASRLPEGARLLFTGQAEAGLTALARRLGVAERIVFLGTVDADAMPAVYRGAMALVFPSLYEGFGLPVVEAMACGVPVMTSNRTALPEVAGDAAFLVDPYSEQEIARAMERLAFDQALRVTLVERGLRRAQRYSWDRVAVSVRKVLAEAASKA